MRSGVTTNRIGASTRKLATGETSEAPEAGGASAGNEASRSPAERFGLCPIAGRGVPKESGGEPRPSPAGPPRRDAPNSPARLRIEPPRPRGSKALGHHLGVGPAASRLSRISGKSAPFADWLAADTRAPGLGRVSAHSAHPGRSFFSRSCLPWRTRARQAGRRESNRGSLFPRCGPAAAAALRPSSAGGPQAQPNPSRQPPVWASPPPVNSHSLSGRCSASNRTVTQAFPGLQGQGDRRGWLGCQATQEDVPTRVSGLRVMLFGNAASVPFGGRGSSSTQPTLPGRGEMLPSQIQGWGGHFCL